MTVTKIAAVAVLNLVVWSVAWRIWARSTYGGLQNCPWDTSRGWQALAAGLVCCVLSAAITGIAATKTTSSPWGWVSGITVGVITGAAIAIEALFFGASLHCTD